MLARWKVAVLQQRKRHNAPPADSAASTPPTSAKTSRWERKDQLSISDEGDDADSIDGILSDTDHRAAYRKDSPVRPRQNWQHQNFLQHALIQKNRIVQRMLVKLKLAEATKETYFAKKLAEYESMIQQLLETKEAVELYAQSLLDVAIAVRVFAGNSSDMRSIEPDDSISFLFATETMEEHSHQFMDQVRDRIVRTVDDRVIDLQQVCELLRERADLQIDVDYAERTLVVAQQRGDVNVIADKKRMLQVAQLRRREATRQITQLLHHYDNKQDLELDNLATEFASVTKHFFQCSATLLRAVEPLPCRGRSNTNPYLATTGNSHQAISGHEPVAV